MHWRMACSSVSACVIQTPFLRLSQAQLLGVAGVAVAAALAWSHFRTRPIYLMDFACFRPDESLKVTYQRFMQGSVNSGVRRVGSERGDARARPEREVFQFASFIGAVV